MNAVPTSRARSAPCRSAGLSLIELMVAVTIGLLLLLGVTTVAINGSRTHREVAQMSEQLENGRYAMQLLTRELRHAGFYGELSLIPEFTGGSLPNPCTTVAADLDDAMQLAVQGYNAPGDGADPLPCLSDANHVGNTDILVIRRAETATTASGSLSTADVYLQTLPTSYLLQPGSGSFTLLKKDGSTIADIRKYRVDIYYISPCSVSSGTDCDAAADGGSPIPTLKRISLVDNGGTLEARSEPLVEGIENLQIDWGIDHSGDGAPNETTPGSSGDDYRAIPQDMNEWKNVVAVRIHLLARNIDPSTEHTDTRSYSLGKSGSVSYSGTDATYKRHLFSSMVRLMNVSMRREQ